MLVVYLCQDPRVAPNEDKKIQGLITERSMTFRFDKHMSEGCNPVALLYSCCIFEACKACEKI